MGLDGSGIVVGVGPAVSRFKIGEEVFGMHVDHGTFAEFCAFDENELVHKPHNVSFFLAAAAPVVGLAAWQALVETGKLERGQRILIHGASGGVGSYAVQLAKYLGAEVIATTSTRHKAFVQSLGADKVIDYTTEKFEQVSPNVDMVLDLVGTSDTRTKSFRLLNRRGKFLTVAAIGCNEPVTAPVFVKHSLIAAKNWFLHFFGYPRIHHVMTRPNPMRLQSIADLMAQGHVKPIVKQMFPIDEYTKAQQQIDTKHTTGKIVLDIMGRGMW